MPKRKAQVLKILIASPSDVKEERRLCEDVIEEFNHSIGPSLNVVLMVLNWEKDSYPGLGADSQDVINRQLGEDFNIFIGIMWTRFGTPTGRAESGTEEEFERAYRKCKEDPEQRAIMFYFSDAPVPPSQINTQQLSKINRFRSKLRRYGVYYWLYTDRGAFPRLLLRHITQQVTEWQKDSKIK